MTFLLSMLFCISSAQEFFSDFENLPQSIFSQATLVDMGAEKISFNELLNREPTLTFSPLGNPNTNLGFTDHQYWVKFSLRNPGKKQQRIFLETGRPITDVVELYQVDESGMEFRQNSGDLLPFDSHPFRHRKIIFPIELEAGKSYTFYIKYESDGEVINLPLNLFDAEAMVEQSYFDQLIFGAFYGILLLAGVIYLFFYFGIREKSFLLYSAYVLSIILLHLSLDGYFFQYFTPNGGWFSQRAVLIFATLSAMAFGRYGQIYLDVKSYSPGLHKSFNGLMLTLIGLLVLVLAVPAGQKFYYPAVNLLGILILFHVISALVMGYVRGKKPDIFFSLGIGCFFLGFTVFILNNFSVLPNNFFTEFSSKLGTGLEVMFLSLSMSNRIRLLKSEKEKMQAIALQQSEESNQIKSFFLSNISHELRTPLNAIIGLSKTIKDNIPDTATKGNLEVIEYSSIGLLNAIDDILDYSKIEKKELKLEFKPFDLHKVLKEVSNMTERQASDKGLKFVFEEIMQMPNFVIGDRTRTRQILLNVLSNAIKFTHEGQVKLGIKTESIGENRIKIVFTIADTGVGIQAEKLDRIFESFIQEQIDDKRKFGGFGLGLCIVKALVDQYGGKLNLESTPGVGTTVSIVLELNQPELKLQPELPKPAPFDLAQKHLLVVEDNPVNQLVMKSILKKWKNTSFDVAFNGLEALEKLKAGKFDLILMDLQMPEMDGYEATEAIRNGSCGIAYQSIPIIAVTADATEKAKSRVFEVGMDDYTTKPIDAEILYAKVKNALVLQEVDISGIA
jgi:signal transduction histidine kinase/ActR/RegA family two-component response regulator